MHLAAAFKWFFKILREGEPAPTAAASSAAPAPPPPPPPPVFTPSPQPAIQLLGLLQQEGRLIDFLHEDIAAYSDAEIGAAVRGIHSGCAKCLRERVRLEPVLKDPEGSMIAVPEGFDPSTIRLLGEVSGPPPFRGTIRHRGWRVVSLQLPTVPARADAQVAAPAEVEI